MHPVIENICCKGSKKLISKKGNIMKWVNFLEGAQGMFGENRNLHNCTIINNQKHTWKDSI